MLGGKARQGSKVESCHRPDRAKTRDRIGAVFDHSIASSPINYRMV
jgi:hypothetical protein